VPVWHQGTSRWVKEGKLVLLGVAQEQHADRCRLLAQWRRFDWPILHDPINLLELSGVPVLVAIDEHGIVRSTRPALADFQAEFLGKAFANDAAATPLERVGPALKKDTRAPDWKALRALARQTESAMAWRGLGDALALWGGDQAPDEAQTCYRRAVQLDPKNGPAWFRLGVCLRRRYESSQAQPGDFQAAIDAWGKALQLDPNQYIWRRRIQQYGPRLEQPYSFYDWVREAEKAVRARGDEPIRLSVRLSGAEIAHPVKTLPVAGNSAGNPDPDGKVQRDTDGLIQAETTVVPGQVRPGTSARVHIVLRPSAKKKTHWNNEAEPLRLWVEPPQAWQVSERLLQASAPAQAASVEARTLTFEFLVPSTARGKIRLSAYALYHICDDAGGQCRFLRLDIPVAVTIEH
jgi:tetratricopeptide (TPR) repeat protein